MKVTASSGGRPITLDPIRVIPITLEIREVESTIPCGFQSMWGEGKYGDRDFDVTAGAGMGSQWGTLNYEGKRYCFDVNQLAKAFLKEVDKLDRTAQPEPDRDGEADREHPASEDAG